jgi:transcriptional regulator with XRE-family HTH domain
MRAEDFFRDLECTNHRFQEEWEHQQPSLGLGLNVYPFRQERGWSDAVLAQRVGMRSGQVTRIERSDADVRLDTVARLGMALGVPVSGLVSPRTEETDIHAANRGPS